MLIQIQIQKFIRKIILHLNIHTIQLKNTDTIIKIVDTIHVSR